MNARPSRDITKQMAIMNAMKTQSDALLTNNPFVAERNADVISFNRRARALTIRGMVDTRQRIMLHRFRARALVELFYCETQCIKNPD